MINLTNAIDINAIEQTFINLIISGLGVQAIIAEQPDAVFPATGDVATVHYNQNVQTGQPSRSYANSGNDLTETVASVKRGTLAINFYRETTRNAMQTAEAFKDFLWSTTAKAAFARSNIGIIQTSVIRNLSELEKARWESRAQLDVEIYAINEISTDVEAIGSISIGGTVQDQTELYTVNVDI